MILQLLRLLITFPIYTFLIWFEKNVVDRQWHVPLRFPRRVSEVYSAPAKFFHLLQRHGAVPMQARFLNMRPVRVETAEPDKQSSCTGIELEYQYAGHSDTTVVRTAMTDSCKTTRLFCKFRTGRGMPLWLQGIRAAAEPGVAREIDFYNKLAAIVPIRVPKVWMADKIPAVNHVILVLEYLAIAPCDAPSADDHLWRVTPDWKGTGLPRMETMLTCIAKMHGMFLGKTAHLPATSWIPAQNGLDYCDFVSSMMNKKKTTGMVTIWKALQEYFRLHQTTLVHGDCRPGNILHSKDEKELIFTDWEAVNVAPPAWDFTYATVLGFTPAQRREHQKHLLLPYQEALWAAAGMDVMCMSRAELRARLDALANDVLLLQLVLFYVGDTVRQGQFWDSQGNTSNDKASWLARICGAVLDLDAHRVSELLSVDVGLVEELQVAVRADLELVAHHEEAQLFLSSEPEQ